MFLAVLFTATGVGSAPEAAAERTCITASGLWGVETRCVDPPKAGTSGASDSSGPVVIYHDSPTNPFQTVGSIVGLIVPCEQFGGVDPQARPDVLFPGADVAFVCEQARATLAAQVQSAFARLTWPASQLLIQPNGGETLVNLDTGFWTTNTRPSVQRVALLGQQVEVEATPVSYRFDFGDSGPMLAEETAELVSASPGLPVAAGDPPATDAVGAVTHRYARAGTVAAVLDTTYAGRYRLGNGPWRAITGTATVAGTPVPLTVREARPVLVK